MSVSDHFNKASAASNADSAEFSRKYELTDILGKGEDGRALYRIRALRDIPEAGVKKGELGGFIEREENLSHEGTCWISDDAKVYGDGGVRENAQIKDDVHIAGHVVDIFGNALIEGDAKIYEGVSVSENAHIYGDATISGRSEISGHAKIYGHTHITGHSIIDGNAKVHGYSRIFNGNVTDNAEVDHAAEIQEHATISGNAKIYGNAQVFGGAAVTDDVKAHGTVRICRGVVVTGNHNLYKGLVDPETDLDKAQAEAEMEFGAEADNDENAALNRPDEALQAVGPATSSIFKP